MAKSRRPPTPPRKQRTRSPSRFRRTETSRLLKGAIDAGLTVRGLEVDPVTGMLRVLVGESGKGEPGTDLDTWMRTKDARST